jgi:hypothetical protein
VELEEALVELFLIQFFFSELKNFYVPGSSITIGFRCVALLYVL